MPALTGAGHQVTATTRSEGNTASLREAGADPLVVDGLDGVAVDEAVARAAPEVVIHEMTAIPALSNVRHFDRVFSATNALRTRGIDHLLAAASAAGVTRMIAQSYAGWPNARTGGPVKTEDDPLDPQPPAEQRESLDAIRYLEDKVPGADGMTGIVLRYGSLYGPGASEVFIDLIRKRQLPVIGDGGGVWSFLHVDDAAAATLAALAGSAGVYNIVDDDPAPVSDWLPAVAEAVGARPPFRIPAWLGKLAAGDVGVSMMTQIRGSSNAKAKRVLDWRPRWSSWRDGFAHGL